MVLKRRIYELLEAEPPVSAAARTLRMGILALIFLSVAALVLESVEPIRSRAGGVFVAFDVLVVAVFTAEYLARLWVITEEPRFGHPLWGRLRWMATPFALIDLLAILPFYLPFVTADLRVLRLARMLRLARVARLARYSRAAQVMMETVRDKRDDLSVSLGLILVMLLIASSLMYYAEHEAQPQAFASIPDAMWWGIVTLTTVGYGDAYPVTLLGRLMGAATAVLGILMLALPTAILSSGFLERMHRDERTRKCPHCGKEVDG
jgi:voltage-gated potassium channel